MVLLVLPNEVLDMILAYLSSMDIVRAFGSISSDRLQALVQSHLVHFDLVPATTDEQTRLLNQTIARIRSLRLTDHQLKHFIKDGLHFDQLESIDLVQITDISVLRLDLLAFAPSIRSLSLHFSADEMSHDSVCCLARVLFNHRTIRLEQVASLSLDGIHIPFGFGALQPMVHLRHLRINLRQEDQLFHLCVHLPRLESLGVDVRSASSTVSDLSVSHRDVSPYLKDLTLSGHFRSHATLCTFIWLYKRTLQRVDLAAIHFLDAVDSRALHDELVQHLPELVWFRY